TFTKHFLPSTIQSYASCVASTIHRSRLFPTWFAALTICLRKTLDLLMGWLMTLCSRQPLQTVNLTCEHIKSKSSIPLPAQPHSYTVLLISSMSLSQEMRVCGQVMFQNTYCRVYLVLNCSWPLIPSRI